MKHQNKNQGLAKWLLAVMIMPLLCLPFVSCSDNDKDDPEGNDIIVGTWIQIPDRTVSLVFNANYSGKFREDPDEEYGETAKFTWSKVDNSTFRIVIDFTDEEIWEATYDARKSLLYVEDEYGDGDFFEKVK